MRNQKGFTLIELVVVIVVLGILAAFAVPRFINMAADARVSAVNACAGSIRAAVALARAQYMVTGDPALATVNMDGTNVTCAVRTGIPTGDAAGIVAALQSTDGFTVTPAAGVVTFQPENGGSATCQASYDSTTGVVTVTADRAGCGG